MAALVYFETSSVTLKVPKAPDPLACGRRSGMFMRLKCCKVSTRCASCSTIGPSGPVVSELRSLTAGIPACVVDPVAGGVFFSAMNSVSFKTGWDEQGGQIYSLG